MDYLKLNNSEIKVMIKGKPISGLLNESWFLELIKVIPELKTLLTSNVLTGVCLSPMTFAFQVNGTDASRYVNTASAKLMALGYQVNIL